MVETYSPPQEALLDPSDTLAEALEQMVLRGVSYVKGFLDEPQCYRVCDQLPAHFFERQGPTLEDEFTPAIGRRLYVPDNKVPNGIWDARDTINRAFEELATRYPQFNSWSERSGFFRNFLESTISIVRYPSHISVGKHVDHLTDEGETGDWKSQAILTLEGEGEFFVYEDLKDKTPSGVIPLTSGTLVILRGSELGHKQLPHAVKHFTQRTMVNFDPSWREERDELRAHMGAS